MVAPSDKNLRIDQAGFTLVELIISMALFSVIMVVLGGVLISSLQADRTVRQVTTSTTEGQLVMNTIDQVTRNATAVRVVEDADGTSVFAVVRSTAGGAAQCVAWFYDAPTKTVFQQRAASAITAPIAGAVGSEWDVLGTGIVPDQDPSGTEYPVLEAQGTLGITARFAVEGGTNETSLFITSVTGRVPQPNVGPQCF